MRCDWSGFIGFQRQVGGVLIRGHDERQRRDAGREILDRDGDRIWFFTRRSSDLVKGLNESAKAYFCVIGDHHDYHACLAGRLRVNRDAAKIEELWNQVVAAWYPGGKDDPEMTLLELQLVDAAIWASKTNPIKFGWEIANANATGEEPEVGVSNHIRFAA